MKYFNLNELIKSDTANAKNIDNTPDESIKAHLIELVENLLDPIREKWAKYCDINKLGNPAIKINSGFRCDALNIALGGSVTSAHKLGYAADIVPVNGNMKIFQDWIKKEIDNFNYDQILFEKVQNNISSWIHIGFKNKDGKQRRQKLKCF